MSRTFQDAVNYPDPAGAPRPEPPAAVPPPPPVRSPAAIPFDGARNWIPTPWGLPPSVPVNPPPTTGAPPPRPPSTTGDYAY